MRDDGYQFKNANESKSKEPRYVVAIIFDVGSIYITSHSDIASVPGIVLQGCLKRPSAISQRVVPDEGRSEIGTFSFDVIDVGSDFTDEVRAKLAAGKGLREKSVRLYVGYRGFDFSAFQLFQTQLISNVSYEQGVYTVSCEDITREQRSDVFDVKLTTLAASCSATDTTITVADTSQFLPINHGSAYSDGPSLRVYYFKIEREIIRATGKTSTTFTGCTRGVINTLAAPHVVDSTTAQDRRLRVEEFCYIEGPAPKVALAMLTGGIFQSWPANLLGAEGGVEVDTNLDGIANGWTKFVGGPGDVSRVYTASLVAGSSPFTATAQRLINVSVTNAQDSGMEWIRGCASGLTFTASCYIRTNATGKVILLMRFTDAAGAGLGDSTSAFVAGDSIAHFAQVTGVAPSGTHQVSAIIRGINANGEFFEFDNVMLELGSTVHPYTSIPLEGVLPKHWHVGMQPESVKFTDFITIGADLWDIADDSAGFATRFEGLIKQDGKRFLEKEIYLLLGSYSPIYSDGTVGLRRLPAMVSDAAFVGTLSERNLVSVGELQHDYKSLHNRIRITWGFDLGLGDYTRDTLFIDGLSISIHGEAPVQEYSFRGLHSGIHTENIIKVRFDTIRDAYSYPPQRIDVRVVPSLNRYEVGDVLRIQCRNVRDFAGAVGDIDRSFVVLRRSIDFVSGDVTLELFGSTLRPSTGAPSTEVTAPLPDAYYNSAGVALNAVVSMTGNTVNVGTYALPGNANVNNSAAIYYHLGDLVIPNGVTFNITNNVQLRARGFITFNGAVIGNGQGLAGVSDPGGSGLPATPIAGNPGFIGNSRGWDGIDLFLLKAPPSRDFLGFKTIPVAIARGKYESWPTLQLEVLGTTLKGIPDDLRGTGGPPGGRLFFSGIDNHTHAGGTGGAGGGGLVLVSRGVSFGVSSQIRLNGIDTTSPGSVAENKETLYRGAGGAGGPGACLILLDGNSLLFPNASGIFQAKTGTITQPGDPLTQRKYGQFGYLDESLSGFLDEAVISNFDMSVAALKIQYLPSTQAPAADDRGLPAAVTSITATPGSGFITVRVGLPPLDTFDAVEIWAAITNDRTGAVRIARGRMDEFQHDLGVLVTRYYWARTVRASPLGIELVSEWNPVSSTAGVVATTLNPGGWTPITTAAGGATMIATASTIEKSGGTSAWDSQAYSAESYPACAVSFRTADATHALIIGLNSDPTTDANYTSIDFAWDAGNAGTCALQENGVNVASAGSYTASNVFLITYDGEYARYFKDNVLIRAVPYPGLMLSLDSSFFTPGGKALDVKLNSQPKVTDRNSFVVSGNAKYAGTTIRKVGGSSAWDSQAYSIDGHTEGAFASARSNDTSHLGAFGLSFNPAASAHHSTIDFAVLFDTSGFIYIDELGSVSGPFVAYTNADVLSVRQVGDRIIYAKNGTPFRSVPKTSSAPLFFDSSLFHPECVLLDVAFAPAGRGPEADTNAVYLETFEEPWESRFQAVANSGSLVSSYPTNGVFGGKVLRAVQQIWLQDNRNVPFDPTFLYRITAAIRRISGSSNVLVYVGVAGVAADGVTLINDSGSNTTSSQHYNCARAFDMNTITAGDWVTFTGYFRGTASSGSVGLVAANVDSPTPLYTGVKYMRPLLIMNYSSGTGTMECDFIKIERLINPDDADNTEKRRVVPDAEFSRSIGIDYWWSLVGGSGVAPVITLTGGLVDGKASFSPRSGGTSEATLISRPRPPHYALVGELYTITIRWRRTGTYSSGPPFIVAKLIRHDQDGSSGTFAFTFGSDFQIGPGSLVIIADTSFTVNQWYETSAICSVPEVDTGLTSSAMRYLSVMASVAGGTTGDASLEIDYVNMTKGTATSPATKRYTTAGFTNLAREDLFLDNIYDNTGAFTFNLPIATLWPKARVYFTQENTGVVTIAYPSGTLISSPNTTGSRNLAGRYAKAYAEWNGTQWRLVGQLA